MNGDVRADIEAERAVLGMILGGSDFDQCAKVLTAPDFYQPRHAEVWSAMGRICDAGEVIGLQSVTQALVRAGSTLDPLYLAELSGGAPMAGDPTWYATRVADEARFRDLAAAATKTHQAATNRGLDITEARDIARNAIDQAVADRTGPGLVRVGDVLTDVIDAADHGVSPGLPTPWPDLDRLIGGLAPGRLVVVGARPGVGKSIMGTNLALHVAAHHRHAVLIASLEMDRSEVVQRLLAARARVDIGHLLDGTLTEREWESVGRNQQELDALPVTIDDAPTQTVTSIRTAARDIKRERDDLALIVVDYLQLMHAPDVDKRANRAEAVGSISRGLKVLARETGACVVAMAQVNREGVKNNGRPGMGDLRESGAIESDANQVVILHRPDEDVPEVEVIVDKNRHGPKGVAALRMIGHYATLGSTSYTPGGLA